MSKLFIDIHKALHSKTESIDIDGVSKPILIGKNKKRYITINKDTFIQADLSKSKYISPKYKDAKAITWIMRPGNKSWGLIVDNVIIRP